MIDQGSLNILKENSKGLWPHYDQQDNLSLEIKPFYNHNNSLGYAIYDQAGYVTSTSALEILNEILEESMKQDSPYWLRIHLGMPLLDIEPAKLEAIKRSDSQRQMELTVNLNINLEDIGL